MYDGRNDLPPVSRLNTVHHSGVPCHLSHEHFVFIDNRLDIDFAIYIAKGDDLRIVIEKKTCENCIHSNNEDDYCLNCIGKLGWELRK